MAEWRLTRLPLLLLSFTLVELIPVWTDCPELGSSPSILNGLLGELGEEELLSEGFFFVPTWGWGGGGGTGVLYRQVSVKVFVVQRR